jgi:hypothetical protein
MTKRSEFQICERFGAVPLPPAPSSKVGIALATIHLQPINGLRHVPENGTAGWYIWGGDVLDAAEDFFKPMHVEHLRETCPVVVQYLCLPPGWRFLLGPSHEDVWFDEALLRT